MFMAYIVDGNNVMGQVPGWHRDKPQSQRKLLEELALFARVMHAAMTVVFDGAPNRDVPEGSAFNGVKVLYADRGSDADTKIERLVESSSNPKGLTVITSDRHLAFLVRSRGATVVRSGEFRKKLKHLLELEPPDSDSQHDDVGDIDGWLRYFGSLPGDDDVVDQ
jgi:predicted RNA-binding protein with PIN domain